MAAPNDEVNAQLTTSGYEQELHGHEYFSLWSALNHASRGFANVGSGVGSRGCVGDCSAAFCQVPLDAEVHVEPPREAQEEKKCFVEMPASFSWSERSAEGLGLALDEGTGETKT